MFSGQWWWIPGGDRRPGRRGPPSAHRSERKGPRRYRARTGRMGRSIHHPAGDRGLGRVAHLRREPRSLARHHRLRRRPGGLAGVTSPGSRRRRAAGELAGGHGWGPRRGLLRPAVRQCDGHRAVPAPKARLRLLLRASVPRHGGRLPHLLRGHEPGDARFVRRPRLHLRVGAHPLSRRSWACWPRPRWWSSRSSTRSSA